MDFDFGVEWFAHLERNVLVLTCNTVINSRVWMARPPSSDVEDWYTSLEIVNFSVPVYPLTCDFGHAGLFHFLKLASGVAVIPPSIAFARCMVCPTGAFLPVDE